MNECIENDCTKPVRVKLRGLCDSHYQRWAEKNRPRGNVRVCSLEDCSEQYYAKDMCRKHYNLLKATGNPYGKKAEWVATPCEVHPNRTLNSKGKCQACVSKQFYWSGPQSKRLDLRKEMVGYEGMHSRLRADRGRAAQYECMDCTKQATDWSLKYNAASVIKAQTGRAAGSLYSLDVNDYEPRCSDCHKKYDAKHQNKKERSPYGSYTRDRRKVAA